MLVQSAGGTLGKWRDTARVGLYLGCSPVNAHSVSLVLNLTTGLVSPQFHVSFDPSFQTVMRTFEGLPLEIKWLEATGFRAKFKTHSSTQRDNSTQSVPPIPPNDLKFSSINDSDF